MTQRERVLAICVGGTLGGLALVWVVRAAVVQPLRSVTNSIKVERGRQLKLEKRLRDLRHVEKDWQDWTARTLSDDRKLAQRRFREDMHKLLERHGFANTKVGSGAFVTRKNGSVEVPLSINATGTLRQVVGFMCDFYRRDYLARLEKVTLTAEQSVISSVNPSGRRSGPSGPRDQGGSSRLRRSAREIGPDGPELKVVISARTLVLPELDKIEHPVTEEIVEMPQGRLRHELVAYNQILDDNLFKPYKPTPVVQRTLPTTQEVDPGPVPVVARDPREGADQQFLVATVSLNGQMEAYVLDKRHGGEATTKYHLDETLDDGKLVLIHRRGLVVGVEENGRTKNYFYPLRYPEPASFADREELTWESHPEVWGALQREFWPGGAGVPVGASRRGS